MVDIKVEKSGIRFKRLDPEYANQSPMTLNGFHVGRIERTKVLSIRVPYEVYNMLSLYAKNNKVSLSEVVRRAIEKYLNGGGGE